jgi:hypothetical protein
MGGAGVAPCEAQDARATDPRSGCGHRQKEPVAGYLSIYIYLERPT